MFGAPCYTHTPRIHYKILQYNAPNVQWRTELYGIKLAVTHTKLYGVKLAVTHTEVNGVKLAVTQSNRRCSTVTTLNCPYSSYTLMPRLLTRSHYTSLKLSELSLLYTNVYINDMVSLHYSETIWAVPTLAAQYAKLNDGPPHYTHTIPRLTLN